MEILPAGIAAGSDDTVDTVMVVGEPARMLVKLRQSGNTDTMLSSCVATTGSPSGNRAYYDLTDHLGCAVDKDILPDFRVSFNSKTETKVLASDFPAFKFPDADVVSVKCSVLVCQTNCPISKCGHRKVSKMQGFGCCSRKLDIGGAVTK